MPASPFPLGTLGEFPGTVFGCLRYPPMTAFPPFRFGLGYGLSSLQHADFSVPSLGFDRGCEFPNCLFSSSTVVVGSPIPRYACAIVCFIHDFLRVSSSFFLVFLSGKANRDITYTFEYVIFPCWGFFFRASSSPDLLARFISLSYTLTLNSSTSWPSILIATRIS